MMRNVFKYYAITSTNLEAFAMKKMHLPIIVEIDEDGYYIVSCPLFKGCHSYGTTIDEALTNIREVKLFGEFKSYA